MSAVAKDMKLKVLKSYTTRARRKNEVGKHCDHTFISADDVNKYMNDMVAYTERSGYCSFATESQLMNSDLYIINPSGYSDLINTTRDIPNLQLIDIWIIYNELSGELYKKFFLTHDEKQAAKDGYIYIHDRSARLDTFNCDLFRVGEVMKNGFEMGNIWYNEPNYLDTAFDVMGDIILSTAAQQYGGFTVPEVDKILEPYAEKSYEKYYQEYMKIADDIEYEQVLEIHSKKASEYATGKVQRDFEQGWQGIEMKLNSVGSSRGDYPFVTMTIGLATSKFGKMAAISLLKVHSEGQGKKGFKRPVLFPKIVFLYDKNLHGDGSDKYPSADVFYAGIDCSSKTMYPDWLSLTGDGYVAEMYKKYGKVVSPMGCRAFLSPWYEKGGMHPIDENDKPIFEGRFNLGVVSLHLPMILAKARRESKDFYEVLDYYLELIRELHKRTYDYIGELRASVNPIAFCEGGLLGGNLKPTDKIKTILPPMTMSYGITALNELQRLYNGKSIREDGQFALEVMQYINDYTNRIKEEDHILYAIYGTPAESLCGLQIEQFRKIYGIIENVSDNPDSGIPFDKSAKQEIFTELSKDYISGITFSGGDPLHENNLNEVLKLVKETRISFPEKTIWLYTGFRWNYIMNYQPVETDDFDYFDYIEESYNDGLMEKRKQIISLCDVVIDGEYIDEQKDLTLKWRGSKNQNCIDVKQSLAQSKMVLYCD